MNERRIFVCDVEANGLDPTKIHCVVGTSDGRNFRKFIAPFDDLIDFLDNEIDVFVCHNGIRFDKRVFEKLLGLDLEHIHFVDSLALSWYLYPKRGPKGHGLAAWGETFGVPKPKVEDWTDQAIDVYLHRCTEDVKINWRLWVKSYNLLKRIYGKESEVWRFLKYLSFKMDCAKEQERSRWKLNREYAQENLKKLEALQEEKVNELFQAMPQVPVVSTRRPPAKPFKADGSLSSTGEKWRQLCIERGLPENHSEPIDVITGYDPPNPASSDQVKKWLFSLGWVPQTFKYKENKETGKNDRPVPQINQDQGKGICESIKKLYDKEPRLSVLDGLSILNHRIPILRGFLDNADDESYVKAEVQGLTNTLRFKHAVVVNLPRVTTPYGDVLRGCLIAPEGYILCGSDMSSLEDRLKQHFMYDYDPEYVEEMNREDYDPHLAIAIVAKMITPEDRIRYLVYVDMEKKKQELSAEQKKDKGVLSKFRSIAKNGNYSCQYGAGPPKIALTAGISLEQAQIVHKAYWEKNWSIKAIAKAQKVKQVDDQKWLFNPISKFWYSLREEKDRFSTLVQGSASYCFDMWVMNIRRKRKQLTAQFHDEVVLCIKKGFEKQAEELLNWAIEETNKQLKLNRVLSIGTQFGMSYSEIH